VDPKTFSELEVTAMTTIRDLAERSGVSVATVSRVLNDYSDVSEKTRRRVLEIARELDYTPSAAARALVLQRSQVIGVVLDTGVDHPDLQHPFFQEVLVALKDRLGEAGFDLLLFAKEPTTGAFGTRGYLKRARHHRVDGVVLMGIDREDPEIRGLVDSKIPCVAVDVDLAGERAGHVLSDNVEGARAAVRHLAELGHTRIATIAGPTATRPGSDRLRGYRSELKALGVPRRNGFEQAGDFYPDTGHAAMTALLALEGPPTAVFAASDLMAVGAVRAAQTNGLDVSGDVSIGGFDDIQLAPLLHPPLTTVRQDKQGLGEAAADVLVRMLERPDARPEAVSLPVELVVRESTGPAPGERPRSRRRARRGGPHPPASQPGSRRARPSGARAVCARQRSPYVPAAERRRAGLAPADASRSPPVAQPPVIVMTPGSVSTNEFALGS
jgi:LacI family transcriptional regulator